MRYIKTIALCALVALGVTAATATAASLITSANIKDGTIKVRDLSPALQAKINKAGTPGAAGATGVAGANGTTGAAGASGQAGANGLDGANGLAGTNGVDGTNGLNGTNGVDGKDGVRYDRLTGTCTTGLPGEVAIAGGAARLGLPEDMSWAQIRAYPHDLQLKDVKRLSFSSNASDRGVVYMKITTTGHNSVVFSPNTQGVDEQGVGSWATHDVLQGTARWNDDAGFSPDFTWAEILEKGGNEYVKDVRFTAGCANPVGTDGALVQFDDLTINHEVIDFNYRSIEPR